MTLSLIDLYYITAAIFVGVMLIMPILICIPAAIKTAAEADEWFEAINFSEFNYKFFASYNIDTILKGVLYSILSIFIISFGFGYTIYLVFNIGGIFDFIFGSEVFTNINYKINNSTN